MKYFLLVIALWCSNSVYAQKDEPNDSIQHRLMLKSGVIVSSDEKNPFWLSANNSQRFKPNESNSQYNNIFLHKSARAKHILDYYYGVEAILSFNKTTNISLIQAYAGISTQWLNLTVGRKEEFLGFNHKHGFGNLVNGNNALPIPKISLSTSGWINAPILKDNISYKAYLAHGWFEKNRYQSGAFLHQKSFHINLHPKSHQYELSFGLTHNAQWGGSNPNNESKQPVGLKNYARIFFASSGGDDALTTDQKNALGNHLGTWDIEGKADLGSWTLSNYWQFLWEDRSGLTPYNWRDGVVGITMSRKNKKSFLNNLNLEIVRTNDQDAEKVRKDGTRFMEPDDFLNNSVYKSGWTYKSSVIGSPIFILLNENSSGNSTIKNMINAVGISASGQFRSVDFRISYKYFSNGGTRVESIDPKLTVSSLFAEAAFSSGNSRFLIQAEYNSGNLFGRNLGVKIEYQYALSQLLIGR